MAAAILTLAEPLDLDWLVTLAHNLAVAGAIAGERLRVLDAFAPRVKLPPRACTCLGSCRGADGLAPGWRCAPAKEQG